jgi:hypothetical protein
MYYQLVLLRSIINMYLELASEFMVYTIERLCMYMFDYVLIYGLMYTFPIWFDHITQFILEHECAILTFTSTVIILFKFYFMIGLTNELDRLHNEMRNAHRHNE